ncbi:MAG: nucleotide exchange factor GrpE [Spirillospora sp.]
MGEVLRRLDELTDLFRRRLQDDRDKRVLIEKLGERLSQAESGPFRQYLHPFVSGLALVLDRLDRYAGPDAEFIASLQAELLQLLSLHGVNEVPVSGAFDPSRHEAVGVREAPGTPPGTVLEVYSRGLAHGSWVFRPARVIVSTQASAPPDPLGSAEAPEPSEAGQVPPPSSL